MYDAGSNVAKHYDAGHHALYSTEEAVVTPLMRLRALTASLVAGSHKAFIFTLMAAVPHRLISPGGWNNVSISVGLLLQQGDVADSIIHKAQHPF